MSRLSRAVALALCTVGMASAVQAGTYVVLAKGTSFDAKLAAKVTAAGGVITNRMSAIGVAIVESNSSTFAAQASKIRGIQSVNADVALEGPAPDSTALTEEEIAAMYANPAPSGDDDFFFDLQWGHRAVDAAGAWNQGPRGNGAVVAVLDSGIACTHPDLAPNIDMALSTSFVLTEGVCLTALNSFNHGSHVAGTIAAADNAFGTIGVAPEAQIIAVKVLSQATGSGSFAGIIQGIYYAASVGADVINMSLGVNGGLPIGGKDVAELVNATARATRYAESQNALVVASAGNAGMDLNHSSGRFYDPGTGTYYTANLRAFPSELPGVLSISATAPIGWANDVAGTFLDNPASYSNFGSAISFAAPGGDSVYPTNENCFLVFTRPCWVFDLVFSVRGYNAIGNPSWGWAAGTSMAAPHASGVAALIIAKNGGEMAPAQVVQIMRASADDLGKPGGDVHYGYGRVNASRAVE